MKTFNINTFIFSCVLIASVSGCGGNTRIEIPDVGPAVQVNPNLVPARRIFNGEEVQGRNGFCRLSDDGTDLLVSIKNIGNGASVDSTTKVTFSVGGGIVQTLPTPKIPGGQTSQVFSFPIPNGCFSSDCSFKIEVDSENTVLEGGVAGGEANNTEAGICIG